MNNFIIKYQNEFELKFKSIEIKNRINENHKCGICIHQNVMLK